MKAWSLFILSSSSTFLSCRVTEFADQAADAKSKLMELEGRYQSMQARSSEDQAAYTKDLGAARRRISDLEESLRAAKADADTSARSADASYKALASDLAKAKSLLENEKAQVSKLKITSEQAERRIQDATLTIQAMKSQLAEATESFTKKLAVATSAAELAETRRIAAERK